MRANSQRTFEFNETFVRFGSQFWLQCRPIFEKTVGQKKRNFLWNPVRNESDQFWMKIGNWVYFEFWFCTCCWVFPFFLKILDIFFILNQIEFFWSNLFLTQKRFEFFWDIFCFLVLYDFYYQDSLKNLNFHFCF